MKLFLTIFFSLIPLFGGELKSYISEDLILKTDEKNNTYIENVSKISFKSGFSVKECIISDRTDSSVSIICIGDGSKNIFTKLSNVSVSIDKIKLNTKYFTWYEINLGEIIQDFKLNGGK
jgi:hypothetical protein